MGKEYVKCWTSPKGNAVLRCTSKSEENLQPVCWTLPVAAAKRLVSWTLPQVLICIFLAISGTHGVGDDGLHRVESLYWLDLYFWLLKQQLSALSCTLSSFSSTFFLPLCARLESHHCHHGRGRSCCPLFGSQSLFWASGLCEKMEKMITALKQLKGRGAGHVLPRWDSALLHPPPSTPLKPLVQPQNGY